MNEKTIILKCKVPKENIGFKDLKRFIYKSHSKEFWAGWDRGWTCNKQQKTMRKTIINNKKIFVVLRSKKRYHERYFKTSSTNLIAGYKRFNIHFGNYCISATYSSKKNEEGILIAKIKFKEPLEIKRNDHFEIEYLIDLENKDGEVVSVKKINKSNK